MFIYLSIYLLNKNAHHLSRTPNESEALPEELRLPIAIADDLVDPAVRGDPSSTDASGAGSTSSVYLHPDGDGSKGPTGRGGGDAGGIGGEEKPGLVSFSVRFSHPASVSTCKRRNRLKSLCYLLTFSVTFRWIVVTDWVLFAMVSSNRGIRCDASRCARTFWRSHHQLLATCEYGIGIDWLCRCCSIERAGVFWRMGRTLAYVSIWLWTWSWAWCWQHFGQVWKRTSAEVGWRNRGER